MRIIAGSNRGRKLFGPKGLCVRPTSDRVKQRIFDILPWELSGFSVLDLFAGTGSLGMEALSRGAERAVFVDVSKACAKIIERNAELCGFEHRTRVIHAPVMKALTHPLLGECSFHLALVDPPYDQAWGDRTLARLGAAKIFAASAEIVIEHTSREALLAAYGPFVLRDQRQVGQTWLSFYTHSS